MVLSMVNKPLISVIMSVYNGERYLKESVRSILKQTFTNFEFIIIDDNSTDNSYEILRSFNDNRIKIIRNKIRKGITKNLNTAIDIAEGEYIARQDADDISLPHRLELQLSFLKEKPDIALVGSSTFFIDDKGRIIGFRKVPSEPTFDLLLKKNLFIHGSVIIRKKFLDEIGRYNELFKYSQDYELWLRIAKRYKVANIQQPLYALRIHKNIFAKIKEQYLYTKLAQKIHADKSEHYENLGYLVRLYGINSIISYLASHEKFSYYKFLIFAPITSNLPSTLLGRSILISYEKLRGLLFLRNKKRLQNDTTYLFIKFHPKKYKY
ncbi:MAG: glycosyltransferase [Candidatus Methanomethylicaceae archaeon]